MAITLIKRNNELPVRRQSGYLTGTYTAATVTNALMTTTNAEATAQAVIASGVITITPGFMPKHVLFQNVTARTSVDWYEGMLFGDTLTTDVNGVKALSTGNIVEVNATTGVITFTLSGQVTDNETLVWVIE